MNPRKFKVSLFVATVSLLSLLLPQPVGALVEPAEKSELRDAEIIRPLPGALDSVPVFNSNCPEVVLGEGVLLSTFKSGVDPSSTLPYEFMGDFDVFFHHIADGKKSGHMENLYLGLVARNDGKKSARLEIKSGASYLSQPDAPFIKLKEKVDNTGGDVYAGPGDRVTTELLLDKIKDNLKGTIEIPPGKTVLVRSFAIPVNNLEPPLNGRNGLLHLHSDRPVSLALVSLFARKTDTDKFVEPQAADFIAIAEKGELTQPRGLKASVPGEPGPIKYGRVAGIATGSSWKASEKAAIEIGSTPFTLHYPISTVIGGMFGTGQIQSAPLAARLADTAWAAHGNYGILYDLTIPVKNNFKKIVSCHLRLDSPVKSDVKGRAPQYLSPPSTMVFFRGTVQHQVLKDDNQISKGVSHLVLHHGEKGPDLSVFDLEPGKTAEVNIRLIYPADSTPPQVVSLEIK